MDAVCKQTTSGDRSMPESHIYMSSLASNTTLQYTYQQAQSLNQRYQELTLEKHASNTVRRLNSLKRSQQQYPSYQPRGQTMVNWRCCACGRNWPKMRERCNNPNGTCNHLRCRNCPDVVSRKLGRFAASSSGPSSPRPSLPLPSLRPRHQCGQDED